MPDADATKRCDVHALDKRDLFFFQIPIESHVSLEMQVMRALTLTRALKRLYKPCMTILCLKQVVFGIATAHGEDSVTRHFEIPSS